MHSIYHYTITITNTIFQAQAHPVEIPYNAQTPLLHASVLQQRPIFPKLFGRRVQPRRMSPAFQRRRYAGPRVPTWVFRVYSPTVTAATRRTKTAAGNGARSRAPDVPTAVTLLTQTQGAHTAAAAAAHRSPGRPTTRRQSRGRRSQSGSGGNRTCSRDTLRNCRTSDETSCGVQASIHGFNSPEAIMLGSPSQVMVSCADRIYLMP